jgi:predicted nucleotidyltransferase component of viral defense system
MNEAVLNPETRDLLKALHPKDLPENSYLAGGTAVALYLGHRRSADLDFFTPIEFTEIQWQEALKNNFGFKLLKRDWQTLIGNIDKVKFSLFGYRYPLIASPELYKSIPVASLPDLAAMKLEALVGRGTKRDFIDIYFLAQNFTLENLFGFYQDKYGNLAERELMLRKSLVYFEDADKEEMPNMLIPANWLEIKKWFIKKIKAMKI